MTDNPKASNVYRFGPYTPTRRSGITEEWHPIRLQPKPFQVLKVLLERAGQSVSREELKGLLWTPDYSSISTMTEYGGE